MFRPARIFLAALAFSTVGAILTHKGGAHAAPGDFGVEVGKPAPDFALPDLQGKWVRLSDFRGKKVLFFQWASWCECRKQLPLLETLYRREKSRNVEVVAAAIDTLGGLRTAPILKKAGATYTALVDQDNLLGELYNVPATQNMFLIDEAGVVKRQWIVDFDLTKPEIAAEVERFLASPPAETGATGPGKDSAALKEQIQKLEAKLQPEEKKNLKLRRALARTHEQRGDLKAAARQYETLIKAKAAKAEDYFSLGSIQYNLGDRENALKNWKTAFQKDSGNYIYMRSIQALEKPEMFYTREKLGELYLEPAPVMD